VHQYPDAGQRARALGVWGGAIGLTLAIRSERQA
jgi:hypothetical protein